MLNQNLAVNTSTRGIATRDRFASVLPPAGGGEDGALDAAFRMIGAPVAFERNVEIFGEEEAAEYYYQVITGAVRTYKVLQDGRRQIGAFHLPGDVFGLEAGEAHAFSAEAIANSTVRVAKRSALVAMAARDSELAADLFARIAGGLRQAQEHMLVLGRKTAEERVATFLLDMARREHTADVIELPMSRQDMADYLGLTIETVSRTLTHLESKSVIALPSSRRILVRNAGSLRRLNA